MENKDLALVWDAIMAPHIDLKWRELSEESRKTYQKFCNALAPKKPEYVTDPSDLRVGDDISAVVGWDKLYSSTWRGTVDFVSTRGNIVTITFGDVDREGKGEFSTYTFTKGETKFLRHSKNSALYLKSLPIDTPVSISVRPGYNNEPPITVKGYVATQANPHTEETSVVIITTQSVRGSNVVSTKNVLDFTVLTQPKDT